MSLAFLMASVLFQSADAGTLNAANFFLENENIIFPADCDQAKKTANEVVDKLVARNFEGVRKYFNENLAQNLSAEQMKTIWTNVLNDTGEYESREKSLYAEYPNDTYGVFTRLQMKKSRVVIEIYFGLDGKIGGFFVKPA